MVDVKHKHCQYPGCSILPIYNLSGETKGKFCTAHKEPGMVNVISKHCEYPECETQPSYNLSGETSEILYCA